MPQVTAKRTLVKSPPELWSELSDVQALARHLGEFGEIRILRAEPEHTVAWAGDRAAGTVSIEPSGWGTRVTLMATELPRSQPEKTPAPLPGPEPGPPSRRGLLGRFLAGFTSPEQVVATPQPAEPEPPPPEPQPVEFDEARARTVLDGTLDALGSARHRPFSRG